MLLRNTISTQRLLMRTMYTDSVLPMGVVLVSTYGHLQQLKMRHSPIRKYAPALRLTPLHWSNPTIHWVPLFLAACFSEHSGYETNPVCKW